MGDAGEGYLLPKIKISREQSLMAFAAASDLLEHHAALDHDEVVDHLRMVMIAAAVTTNLLARVLGLVLTDASRLSGLIGGQLNISENGFDLLNRFLLLFFFFHFFSFRWLRDVEQMER